MNTSSTVVPTTKLCKKKYDTIFMNFGLTIFLVQTSGSAGGMLQARTFGARTRTFCSVPEHFAPCTNKMFFFNTFLKKNLFIYTLRPLNYLFSAPNLFISV
jgi:hypothetical protein